MVEADKRSDKEYGYLTRRNSEIAHTVRSVVGNLSRYGMFLLAIWMIANYGYLSIKSLSGQTTIADIVVRTVHVLNVHIWLSWTVSAGSLYLWNREKTLRQRHERRNSQLEKDLQKTIDRARELERRQNEGLDLLSSDETSLSGILKPEDVVD